MANLWQLRQTIREKNKQTNKQTKKSAKNFRVTYKVDLLRKKSPLEQDSRAIDSVTFRASVTSLRNGLSQYDKNFRPHHHFMFKQEGYDIEFADR